MAGARKPNKFYKGVAKTFLEVGARGFLATTNFREKECVRECYNILNTYADELYGAEQLDDGAADEELKADAAVEATEATDAAEEASKDAKVESAEEDEEEEVEDEDIATTLANEIQSANAAQAKSNRRRRFQQVGTGAANCVFIKTALRDPVRLAAHIVRHVAATRQNITRNVLRFVPVEAVCKANVPDIKNAAGLLFDRHFLNAPATTYSVVYNRRCNNDLDRDEIIRELARLVDAKNAEHKVDLKGARVSVLVEIVKGLCCLSVVPEYMLLKKYNLAELVGVTRPKAVEAKMAGQTGTESVEPERKETEAKEKSPATEATIVADEEPKAE